MGTRNYLRTTAIIAFILGNISCNNAQPAIYFIPNNFEGIAAVIYSQKTGIPVEYQNGRRAYRIPNNGILITQFDFESGDRNDLFLMIKQNGFDTLKEFIPGAPFNSTKYKTGDRSTHDTLETAINFRQVITFYPKFFKVDQRHKLDSSFRYELITIGKASKLKDDSLKEISRKIDKYLNDSFARN